jgi:UDP:flavonoid glycosyltransferase YjiC (YdhE family)
MVPLAQAFRDAGHQVLWATAASGLSLVEEAGLETERAGLHGEQLAQVQGGLRSRAAALPPPERAAFMFPTMFGEALTPPMLADLLPIAERFRPDLMVHEHAELASPVVGAALGVPSATHAFGGAVPAAFLAEAGTRTAHLWEGLGLDQPSYAGCFESAYLDICPPSVQGVPLDHVAVRRPLRPVPWSGRPHELGGLARPLVYFTLGTVSNASPVLEVAVRSLARLPVQLLVTVGPDGDPAALGQVSDNVRVERWVPQAQLLPRCDVVVSHAGSGTFLGALAAGVPQLCLPQAADQFRNAEAGVRAGVALSLAPHEADGEAIAAATRRLLDEPAFAEAARTVQAEIAAMPSPAEVAGALLSG